MANIIEQVGRRENAPKWRPRFFSRGEMRTSWIARGFHLFSKKSRHLLDFKQDFWISVHCWNSHRLDGFKPKPPSNWSLVAKLGGIVHNGSAWRFLIVAFSRSVQIFTGSWWPKILKHPKTFGWKYGSPKSRKIYPRTVINDSTDQNRSEQIIGAPRPTRPTRRATALKRRWSGGPAFGRRLADLPSGVIKHGLLENGP